MPRRLGTFGPRLPKDIAAVGGPPPPIPGGGGKGGGGVKDVAADSAITRQVFPPWLYPPESNKDFIVNTINGAKTAVLPAGAGQFLLSDSFAIPAENLGANQFVTIFVDAPTALINVDWILQVNGGPVAGWTVTTFPRVANNLSITFPGIVRASVGANINVRIINRDGEGPWTVGVSFGGWFYSRRFADQLYGGIY